MLALERARPRPAHPLALLSRPHPACLAALPGHGPPSAAGSRTWPDAENAVLPSDPPGCVWQVWHLLGRRPAQHCLQLRKFCCLGNAHPATSCLASRRIPYVWQKGTAAGSATPCCGTPACTAPAPSCAGAKSGGARCGRPCGRNRMRRRLARQTAPRAAPRMRPAQNSAPRDRRRPRRRPPARLPRPPRGPSAPAPVPSARRRSRMRMRPRTRRACRAAAGSCAPRCGRPAARSTLRATVRGAPPDLQLRCHGRLVGCSSLPATRARLA